MSDIDFNKMLARIQYSHADEAHEAMAAIRAHVEALEKEVESLNNIVVLSERIGDIRAAVKQELTDAFQKRYEAAERDRERFRERALPPGVTVEEVRGVLEDVLRVLYDVQHGGSIGHGSEDLMQQAAALLAKLTAQPADANGKDGGE